MEEETEEVELKRREKKKLVEQKKVFSIFQLRLERAFRKKKKLPALLLGLFSSFSFFWNISAMLLRNLQDRATGRRVSAGEGVSSAANEGTDATSPTTTTTTQTPTPTPKCDRACFVDSNFAVFGFVYRRYGLCLGVYPLIDRAVFLLLRIG